MLPNNGKVYLYNKPIDMRKGVNSLSIFIASELVLDPGDGSVYIFYSSNFKKLKLVYWYKNGFCLFYKILSKEKFKIPVLLKLKEITHDQLRWLYEGLDFNNIKGFRDLKYTRYF